MIARHYKQTAIKYAEDVIHGAEVLGNATDIEIKGTDLVIKGTDFVLTDHDIVIAGDDIVNACKRFLEDLKREDIEYRSKDPDACITLMEGLFVHRKGEKLDGTPLLGKPLRLEPWQVFIVCNLLGFYIKGTQERRFKEAMIMLGRKNGKTSFVAALSFAVSIMQRRSGSTVYVVAAALKQSMESYKFIDFSLTYKGIRDEFSIKDNAMEHSIQYTFEANGVPDGSIDIQIMASNPDAQDSFNCNFAIADEMAAYKKASQYNRFKEAMKGYTNKLMIGITTAGDNANSFGYRRMEYAAKVAAGTVKDDEMFAFIARADVDDKGNCDYTNPIQHRKANPSYGVTIRPKEILNDALQAQNDPQQRKDFLSRSLNIYTTALKAWFDIEEFRASDRKYNWTLEELTKLKIDWFGGADLSRVYDLTAAALVGRYENVDIIITHGFTPVAQAAKKSDEDNIPLFGWEEDGWLTMCNSPTVNIGDIVNWFVKMRKMGFRIKAVGHDRKFAGEEYFPAMKKAGFNVIDQPQYFYLKSQGFRHIETAAKNGSLYYLHSTAYEYCVQNVAAVEKTDDAVQYEKVSPEMRIDLFDASVFATIQMVAREEKEKKGKEWWGDE
jgi:phage terminase large subunit-like protein